MINVTLHNRVNSISLTIKGHAGIAEVGKDIVCAAASILANTLAYVCSEMVEKQKAEPTIKLKKGYGAIVSYPLPGHREEIENAFRFAQKGFELLQYNYPDFVKFKEISDDKKRSD